MVKAAKPGPTSCAAARGAASSGSRACGAAAQGLRQGDHRESDSGFSGGVDFRGSESIRFSIFKIFGQTARYPLLHLQPEGGS